MTGASGQQAAAFYDEVWQRYAHLDAVSPAAFHRRRLIVELAAEAAPDARAVLDVGCGQGELLGALGTRLRNAELSGADVSEQSIADSRRRNPTMNLFQLDLTDPDFDTKHAGALARYDLVICSEVLEHIVDDQLAARRLVRLLKPGGALVVTVPGGKMSRYDQAIGHQRHYRSRELKALLQSGGLESIRVLAWGFPFHSLYRSAVRLASRFAMSSEGESTERGTSSGIGALLGKSYALFGATLKPLFYLNTVRRGEQMLAVARKPDN